MNRTGCYVKKNCRKNHFDWEIMGGLQGIEFTRQKVGLRYISRKGNTIDLLTLSREWR